MNGSLRHEGIRKNFSKFREIQTEVANQKCSTAWFFGKGYSQVLATLSEQLLGLPLQFGWWSCGHISWEMNLFAKVFATCCKRKEANLTTFNSVTFLKKLWEFLRNMHWPKTTIENVSWSWILGLAASMLLYDCFNRHLKRSRKHRRRLIPQNLSPQTKQLILWQRRRRQGHQTMLTADLWELKRLLCPWYDCSLILVGTGNIQRQVRSAAQQEEAAVEPQRLFFDFTTILLIQGTADLVDLAHCRIYVYRKKSWKSWDVGQ